ncbi:tail fiber protein [Pectinatus frisingensis]
MWPTANWYQDMKAVGGNPDNYLECDGQAVDAANYPNLVKIMGTVPNYQGLFLRGLGGNSEAIGNIQGDAIRNITGTLDSGNSMTELQLFGETPTTTGVFENFDWFHGSNGADEGNYYRANGLSFDASRVVPTANENRPINTAVIYLIKAK